MASTTPDPTQAAFEEAARDFKSSLNNDKLYQDILKFHSVDDVYDATDKLQAAQCKENKGRMRNLAKMEPYLEKLRQYHDVINVFVQVKPEILALIWGPILLLIQLTSSLTQSLDAIINTTSEIGSLLPEFTEMTSLFSQNQGIKGALVLFFRDILEFYVVALTFFSLSRPSMPFTTFIENELTDARIPGWHILFESVWPRQKEKIKIVVGHIQRHTSLMRSEVRLEQIRGEQEAQKKALEHFELTEKANKLQEFNRIITSLNIKLYDRDFDRIHGRTCSGTGQWLLEDDLFIKWLDTTDSSSNFLWLQGIPGAGKTFLAATAIMQGVRRRKTAFAFLSHVHSASTTALTVMHSLILQLSSEDEYLQSVVCQAATARLRMDLDITAQLLQDLVSCIGSSYLIIDGLDEVEEVERKRLLEKLVTLSKSCPETRLLISSRAENDIARLLDPVAGKIRVDTNNSEAIRMFLEKWTQEWFDNQDFFPECREEIKSLLAPLSSKARGMFLYVQIMLNSIEPLSEIDEIRSELRVLPENLDEAYGRIFRRINSHSSDTARKKCRTILGWICCSPTPMTLRELEQLLVVHSNPEGSCRVSSSLNIVKLCGPIVEVIDDFVHMVHFTVKEYLTGSLIHDSIDIAEANLSLAICCIRYLCQSHHNLDQGSSDLEKNMIDGLYRLHHYACTMWLDLVVSYLRQVQTQDLPSDLIDALNILERHRSNPDFDPGSALEAIWYPLELQRFQADEPDLFRLLKFAAQFIRKANTSQFQLEKPKPWAKLSPFTIFQISAALQAGFDKDFALNRSDSSDWKCARIVRHYGQLRYKCHFISCPNVHLGFETRSSRNLHHKDHSRVWKCDVPSCHYSKFGFLSERMRADHHQRSHLGESASGQGLVSASTTIDEIRTLLYDCIYSNNLEMAKMLFPELKKHKRTDFHEPWENRNENRNILIDLRCFAAHSGTREIASFFMKGRDRIEYHLSIAAAVQGQNMSTLDCLLKEVNDAPDPKWSAPTLETAVSKSLAAVIATDLIEIREAYQMTLAQAKELPLMGYFSSEVINATRGDAEREAFLVKFWNTAIHPHFSEGLSSSGVREAVQFGLNKVAETTCSIPLAKILLVSGADVNAQKGTISRSPLHRACLKDTAKAAEFAKFLLYEGANPNAKAEPRLPKGQRRGDRGRTGEEQIRPAARFVFEEEGAKNISKWLGITWKELVQKVRRDRKNKVLWPGSFPTVDMGE